MTEESERKIIHKAIRYLLDHRIIEADGSGAEDVESLFALVLILQKERRAHLEKMKKLEAEINRLNRICYSAGIV